MQLGIYTGFETQARHHLKSKITILIAIFSLIYRPGVLFTKVKRRNFSTNFVW